MNLRELFNQVAVADYCIALYGMRVNVFGTNNVAMLPLTMGKFRNFPTTHFVLFSNNKFR